MGTLSFGRISISVTILLLTCVAAIQAQHDEGRDEFERPEPGTALVYFIWDRGETIGPKDHPIVVHVVKDGGTHLCALKPGTFWYTHLTPGTHDLWATGASVYFVGLPTTYQQFVNHVEAREAMEPGTTRYFLLSSLRLGMTEVSSDVGMARLHQTTYKKQTHFDQLPAKQTAEWFEETRRYSLVGNISGLVDRCLGQLALDNSGAVVTADAIPSVVERNRTEFDIRPHSISELIASGECLQLLATVELKRKDRMAAAASAAKASEHFGEAAERLGHLLAKGRAQMWGAIIASAVASAGAPYVAEMQQRQNNFVAALYKAKNLDEFYRISRELEPTFHYQRLPSPPPLDEGKTVSTAPLAGAHKYLKLRAQQSREQSTCLRNDRTSDFDACLKLSAPTP